MVALLHRVPLDAINRRAGERTAVGRTLLALLAGVLYGVGWLVAKAVRGLLTAAASALWGLGFAARWVAAAVAVGWQDAAHGGR